MKNKAFNISAAILSTMLTISMIFLFYTGTMLIIAEKNNQLEVKAYQTEQRFNYNLQNTYSSNEEIRHDLSRLYNPVIYFYAESELHSSIGAQTILPLRYITVNTLYIRIPYAYTFFLAHEFVHITYTTNNECFTEFTTIKTLYESGNEWFKNVALWRANDIVSHNLQDNYDCGYYILEYFKERGLDNM